MGVTALTQRRAGNRNSANRASMEPGPWLRWRTRRRSARAARFIETYCIVPKGHGAGRPMRLAKFQRELLELLLDDASLRAGMVSISRGNGKSSLLAALALWALYDDEHSPSVPVIATTVGQAKRSVYNVALSMVARSPELAERTISYTAIGGTRLYVPFSDGELFPMASAVDGLQGLDPSFAVVDEVGFLERDQWEAMVLASGKRPRSLVVGIGTPNVERSGALWELRELVTSGVTVPGFRLVEYAAPEGCPIGDRAAWRLANPALVEGFLAADALEMAVAGTPEPQFRVFRLGQWAQAAECWLPPGAWEALVDPWELQPGAPTWVGVDIGLQYDSSAVAVVQRRPDGRLHVTARVWDPAVVGRLDPADVQQHLRELCDRFDVRQVSYDPRLFEWPGQELADEGLPMMAVPQSRERMIPVCANGFELISAGKVSHDGDATLTAHILAARQRPAEGGWTLSKSKSRRRIDACIASLLALHVGAEPPAPAWEPFIMRVPL